MVENLALSNRRRRSCLAAGPVLAAFGVFQGGGDSLPIRDLLKAAGTAPAAGSRIMGVGTNRLPARTRPGPKVIVVSWRCMSNAIVPSVPGYGLRPFVGALTAGLE